MAEQGSNPGPLSADFMPPQVVPTGVCTSPTSHVIVGIKRNYTPQNPLPSMNAVPRAQGLGLLLPSILAIRFTGRTPEAHVPQGPTWSHPECIPCDFTKEIRIIILNPCFFWSQKNVPERFLGKLPRLPYAIWGQNLEGAGRPDRSWNSSYWLGQINLEG